MACRAETFEQFGTVSAETAEAMAIGKQAGAPALWAVSATGNAGPTTDGEQAPVGMVYVGISGPGGTKTYHWHWPTSDCVRVRAFAAQMALDLLNRKLESVRGADGIKTERSRVLQRSV